MNNSLCSFLGFGAIAAIPFLVGFGGLLSVCHISALDSRNFFANGQCHASDTPSDVFTSFLMLGVVIAAMVTVGALVVSFVKRRYLEGKG